MSKQCNGIMYMKDKRIQSLQLQSLQLNSTLTSLITLNQQLKQTQSKTLRQLIAIQNQYQIVQLDSKITNKTISDLEKKADYLKGEYTKLEQSVQEEQGELRDLQRKVEMYREMVEQKQILRGRYTKESQMNEKMIKASGKIFNEKQKVRKELERGERELAVLKNNLTAKNRFIGVLEKKVGGNPKSKREGLMKMKSQEKLSIGDVIDDIEEIKMRKMKSFDKLVRQKNAILLKPKKG